MRGRRQGRRNWKEENKFSYVEKIPTGREGTMQVIRAAFSNTTVGNVLPQVKGNPTALVTIHKSTTAAISNQKYYNNNATKFCRLVIIFFLFFCCHASISIVLFYCEFPFSINSQLLNGSLIVASKSQRLRHYWLLICAFKVVQYALIFLFTLLNKELKSDRKRNRI